MLSLGSDIIPLTGDQLIQPIRMTFALAVKWFIKRKMGNSTARSFAELEIVSNWLQEQTNKCNYHIHQIHVLSAIQARKTKEKMRLIWGRSNGSRVGRKT